MAQVYEDALKKLMDEYTTGDFYREVYQAKQEYFADPGPISEDDTDFENQMDIFMGWYLFDRNLSKFDLPPVLLYYRKNEAAFADDDRLVFSRLTNTVHSIFEFLKVKGSGVLLRDYCSREKYEVSDTKYSAGFSKGDIFESRLIPMPTGTSYAFAPGFSFHPRESSRFIDAQVKKIRYQDVEQRNKFLLLLNRMKLKHQRFPHIDVKHIYTLEPKF